MRLVHHVVRQNNGSQEFPPGFLAETRQPQMIAGNAAVQIVGSLFFFARVYSRYVIMKSWRLEDYVLTLSWIFCTGYSACQYGQIANGYGRHIIATSMHNPEAHITSQKYAYAAQILLFPALTLAKMSICLTYLRIFYQDRCERYMFRALLVILVLLTIPFMFQVAFQCWPIEVYWTEGRPPSGKCLKDLPSFYLNGSLNIFVDIALMCIVLPRIIGLRLPKRQRMALVGIVLIGTLAVTAGLVRMVRVSRLLTMPNFEPSWDAYDVSIWTSTEIYVSLFCASAPGVKPLIVKILPKILGSSFSREHAHVIGEGSTSIELGLGSKWQGLTISRIWRKNKGLNDTTLDTADGPYIQVGSDVDARNLSGHSDTPMTATSEGHIYKTSEIAIQNHAV